MNAVVAKEPYRDGTVSADDASFTMSLTLPEVLIVKWYRGDRSVSAEQLEAALALGKAGAKPVA